jgi:hemin uptake protein HemP
MGSVVIQGTSKRVTTYGKTPSHYRNACLKALTVIMRTIIVHVKMDTTTPKQTPPTAAAQVPGKVSSEALFGARRELVILHNGREYRLRLTQNGKLILTA